MVYSSITHSGRLMEPFEGKIEGFEIIDRDNHKYEKNEYTHKGCEFYDHLNCCWDTGGRLNCDECNHILDCSKINQSLPNDFFKVDNEEEILESDIYKYPSIDYINASDSFEFKDLKEIHIPESVEFIATDSFSNYTKLERIIFNNNTNKIPYLSIKMSIDYSLHIGTSCPSLKYIRFTGNYTDEDAETIKKLYKEVTHDGTNSDIIFFYDEDNTTWTGKEVLKLSYIKSYQGYFRGIKERKEREIFYTTVSNRLAKIRNLTRDTNYLIMTMTLYYDLMKGLINVKDYKIYRKPDTTKQNVVVEVGNYRSKFIKWVEEYSRWVEEYSRWVSTLDEMEPTIINKFDSQYSIILKEVETGIYDILNNYSVNDISSENTDPKIEDIPLTIDNIMVNIKNKLGIDKNLIKAQTIVNDIDNEPYETKLDEAKILADIKTIEDELNLYNKELLNLYNKVTDLLTTAQHKINIVIEAMENEYIAMENENMKQTKLKKATEAALGWEMGYDENKKEIYYYYETGENSLRFDYDDMIYWYEKELREKAAAAKEADAAAVTAAETAAAAIELVDAAAQKTKTNTIIGASIGGVVFVGLVVFVIIKFKKRKNRINNNKY
jgi:hypothetical protein